MQYSIPFIALMFRSLSEISTFPLTILLAILLPPIIPTQVSGQSVINPDAFCPSDRSNYNQFGYSTFISKEFVFIGALGSASNNSNKYGKVYIYKNAPRLEYLQQVTIWDSVGQNTVFFGHSIAFQNDYLFVGAPYAGSSGNPDYGQVYIFKFNRSTNRFLSHQIIRAPFPVRGAYFGGSICAAGDKLYVGSMRDDRDAQGRFDVRNAGAVFIYKINSSDSFLFYSKITPELRESFEEFGTSITCNEEHLVVSSLERVYFYKRALDGTLDSSGVISNPRWNSLSIHEDMVVIGNPQKKVSIDSVTLNAVGEIDLYKYNDQNNSWEEFAKVENPYPKEYANFGDKVSISKDNLIVGAFGSPVVTPNDSLAGAGEAYLYSIQEDTLILASRFVAANPKKDEYFGRDVSIHKFRIVIGAIGDNYNCFETDSVFAAGKAFMYDLKSRVDIEEEKLSIDQVKLHPNPSSGKFAVFLRNSDDIQDISLITGVGETVPLRLNKKETFLPSHLANGIYYVKVSTAQGTYIQKLVFIK